MSLPFVKTNLHFTPLPIEQYKGDFIFRGSSIHKFNLKRLYTILDHKKLSILNPQQICLSEAYNDFVPHFDVKAGAKLNIYLQTADGITHFWKKKPGVKAIESQYYFENFPSKFRVANQFHENDLIPWASFTATPGSAYLLDVSKIHSVDITPDKTRTFIQLSWFSEPFDTVIIRVQMAGLIDS